MERGSLEAAAYLVWARLALRRRALAEIRRQLEKRSVPPPGPRSNDDLERALVLGRTTLAVARRLPFHCTCLVQAVALTAMLRRRGLDADLRLGARQAGTGDSRITAHAWVEYDHTVVLDSEHHEKFVPFGNS
jgi:hypothetical protein